MRVCPGNLLRLSAVTECNATTAARCEAHGRRDAPLSTDVTASCCRCCCERVRLRRGQGQEHAVCSLMLEHPRRAAGALSWDAGLGGRVPTGSEPRTFAAFTHSVLRTGCPSIESDAKLIMLSIAAQLNRLYLLVVFREVYWWTCNSCNSVYIARRSWQVCP